MFFCVLISHRIYLPCPQPAYSYNFHFDESDIIETLIQNNAYFPLGRQLIFYWTIASCSDSFLYSRNSPSALFGLYDSYGRTQTDKDRHW